MKHCHISIINCTIIVRKVLIVRINCDFCKTVTVGERQALESVRLQTTQISSRLWYQILLFRSTKRHLDGYSLPCSQTLKASVVFYSHCFHHLRRHHLPRSQTADTYGNENSIEVIYKADEYPDDFMDSNAGMEQKPNVGDTTVTVGKHTWTPCTHMCANLDGGEWWYQILSFRLIKRHFPAVLSSRSVPASPAPQIPLARRMVSMWSTRQTNIQMILAFAPSRHCCP